MIFQLGEWMKDWTSVIADTTTVIALIAAFFGWTSYTSRREAEIEDERHERELRAAWFRQAQWGMDLLLSDDERRQMLGLSVIQRAADSPLATKADKLLLVQVLGLARSRSPREDGYGQFRFLRRFLAR